MSKPHTTPEQRYVDITPRNEETIHQTGDGKCWCNPAIYAENGCDVLIAVHRHNEGEECYRSRGKLWRPIDEVTN